METLTLQIPEEKHRKLKQLAESRGISINQLLDELSTILLVESDTYHRFQTFAAQGDRHIGLQCLDQLDNRPVPLTEMRSRMNVEL